MRSQAICIAVFLALSGAASAAQPPTPTTCTKTPHAGKQPVTAQFIAARHAMKQACAADMANYCADVPRGCGAPRKCLKAHVSQLSASCSSAWQNMRTLKGQRS
jgi:hypothetical protein